MKKLIALVLSLVMALSLCVPAWGETTVVDSESALRAAVADLAIDTIDLGGNTISMEFLIEVKRAVTITNGTLARADGCHADRSLVVVTGADAFLTLDGVTIDGRNVPTTMHTILVENGASLTLENSTVKNNSVTGRVAAIHASQAHDLTLINSTVSDNTTNVTVAGIFVHKLTGTFTLDKDSVVSNNTAKEAAGIEVEDSNAIIAGTITGNTSTDGKGGGLYTFMTDTTKTVTIDGATITDNAATEAGPDMVVNGPATSTTPGNVVVESGTIGEVGVTRGALDVNGGTIEEINVLPDARNDKGAVLNVTDGEIGSVTKNGDGGAIAITGGTFGSDVSTFAGQEAVAEMNVDGAVTYIVGAAAINEAIEDAAVGTTFKVVNGSVALGDGSVLGDGESITIVPVPVICTVSFDANGGTDVMANEPVEEGAEYTLPANGFTAPEGKQFKAWSVGGTEKAVGDKITITADTTVTAVWEDIPVVTYTVSFNAGNGSGTMADVTVAAGSEYTLPECGFSAPYYFKVFKAWSVNGVENKAGDKITVTADTEVTAVWKNRSSGGYYVPSAPDTTDKTVTSADTFDAGIGLYVGMSVLSALGGAVALRKRED